MSSQTMASPIRRGTPFSAVPVDGCALRRVEVIEEMSGTDARRDRGPTDEQDEAEQLSDDEFVARQRT